MVVQASKKPNLVKLFHQREDTVVCQNFPTKVLPTGLRVRGLGFGVGN